MTGPLCDSGRCAQLVQGLAQVRSKMVDTQAVQLAQVLTWAGEDVEVALDERQRAAWPSAVQRAISRLTGDAPT